MIVEFQNVGAIPLQNLKVASTHPEFFTFSDKPKRTDKTSVYQTLINTSDSDSEEFPRVEKPIKHVIDIPLSNGCLKPGDSVTLPMWIRGPEKAGKHQVHFLFYYEPTEKHLKLKYV